MSFGYSLGPLLGDSVRVRDFLGELVRDCDGAWAIVNLC